MRFCIVCGNSEDDVKHLFCFPRSADRSQIWQEAMGMKYRPLCGHVRICNEHFTKDRFVPCTSVLRLKADAVPTILEVQKDHVMKGLDQIANKKVNIISQYIIKPEPQTLLDTKSLSNANSEVTEHEKTNSSQSPSQRAVTPISSTVRCRRTLFKDVEGLCSTQITPRKQKLMVIVKRKQGRIRKLQKVCKQKGKRIKTLENIAMNNCFKGMPSTISNFMMSQIRCAKRSPHGRRWTLDDKIMSLAIYKRSPKCYALLERL
ncbi:uncharacterized protein LOC130894798 [Diorhabda carinulata]|uniref:uncharacterized protein LOC130894798 n=1 Tax=Diorhabda carinulata TaxID=1163345 RepID=UPI0025A0938A|nr:uncharacterized protein LOC130894798 [Diorhabda carinulata]